MTSSLSDKRLDDLLNDIEINCNPAIGSEQCNGFSVECLSLIRHRLPPIACEALDLLKDYRTGRTELESVTKMIVQCWKYLDEKHGGREIHHPEVSAVRAVIFPLDAQKHPKDRNIVDHLSFFLTLVNNVEPHCEEEEALLRKHFAECL